MKARSKGRRLAIRSDERGNAMPEYISLLAVIALVVFFAITWAGPWAYSNFIDASIPLMGDDACAKGQYHLVRDPVAANGVDRDINEDGWYCMKDEANVGNDLPGNGNNNDNADIMDNIRPNP